MTRRSHALAALTLALAAAGCVSPAPTRPGDPKATVRPVVAIPRPASSPTLDRVEVGAGSTWARDAAEGSLIGKIRGPVGLMNGGNNGSLISDHGSGVVSNNGGTLRLLAVEEVAASGLTVRLLGADGKAFTDAAGQPVETVTAADGSYTFKGFVPTRNLVVAAELPGGRGRLAALAVRSAGAALVVDVDLASTVTAAWVLDRLVGKQNDPAATLDRLTLAAESDARAQAASAVQARATALPTYLDAAAAANLADALRSDSPGFAAGLSSIERILVAGGQRGLGEGLPASEVALGLVRQLVVTPAGSTYIGCPQDGKIWKVGADGLLRTAIGKGIGAAELAIDGRPGAEVSLGPVLGMVAEGEDGLLVLEKGPVGARLLRLASNGRLAIAGTLPGLPITASLLALVSGAIPAGLARVPGGVVILSAPSQGAAQAWLLPDQGVPRQVHTFDEPASAILRQAVQVGSDGQGAIMIAAARRTGTVRLGYLQRLDPTTFVLTPLAEQNPTAQLALAIDDRGRTIAQAPDKSLAIGMPATRSLAARGLPALGNFDVVAAKGDDLLIASGDVVYRLGAATLAPFAGLIEPPGEVPAARLGLRNPIALAVDPAGRQYVYDDANRTLWAIDTDGLARRRIVLPAEIGGAPVEVTALRPAGERLLLIDDAETRGAPHRLFTFGPSGAPQELLRLASDFEELRDAGPAPGGGYYALTVEEDAEAEDVTQVVELDAAGAVKARFPVDEARTRMAFGPAGEIWLGDDVGLARWTPADGEVPIAMPPAWAEAWDPDTWLAADARGRIYGTSDDLWRFDPASGQVTPVAQDAASIDTVITPWLKFPGLDATGNLFYLEQNYRQIRLIRPAALN